MTAESMPDLLTAAEVAQLLRTTTSALAQDRYRGYGPTFIRVGRRIRYDRATILAYIEANTYQQTPGSSR